MDFFDPRKARCFSRLRPGGQIDPLAGDTLIDLPICPNMDYLAETMACQSAP